MKTLIHRIFGMVFAAAAISAWAGQADCSLEAESDAYIIVCQAEHG